MITRLVARRAVMQGLIWGAVFGLYNYASAAGYAASYRTPLSRGVLAKALGTNSGLTMLLGRAHSIDTVAGFTAWRGVGLLSLVGGVWGMLAGTRLLRGEEETGRWELLLSGPVTTRRATRQAIAGLGLGWLALFTATTALTAMTAATTHFKASATAVVFFAFAVTVSAAVFLSVAVLVGQLTASRRHAAMITGGVLGASMVVRMLADSQPSMRWLAWLSPLGWIENAQPLTESQPATLVPAVLLVAVLVGSAYWVSGRRDVGAGLFERHDASRAHMRTLTGPVGLAVRTMRPVAIGWTVALALLGVLFGLVAKSAAQATADSESFRRALAQLGGKGNGAAAYLGVTFILATTLLMLIVAGRIADGRDEEGNGRLEHLLVRPVGRGRWFAERLGLALVLAVICAEVFATGEWVGAASQHAGVGLGRLLLAGLNAGPAAAVLLGVGALVHGIAARWATVVTYAFIAWAFLVEFVAQLVTPLHWLRDTSVLFHIAPAPAADPNWTSAAVLVGIGLAAAAVGTAVFVRRDLVSD